MKKVFYLILAAAAVLTACAKQEVDKKGISTDENAVFSGTIIQPAGLENAKVSILEETDNNVFITWEEGDKIWVEGKSDTAHPLAFYAQTSEATTLFRPYNMTDQEISTWLGERDASGYCAYFFGRNDAWIDYTDNYNVSCQFTDDAWQGVPVLLQNMPLKAELDGPCSDEAPRLFEFSSTFAILEIKVPSKLDFNKLYVCKDNQNVAFEDGSLENGSTYEVCVTDAEYLKQIPAYSGKDIVKVYVPITIPQSSYHKFTLVASKFVGNAEVEVARMATYEYAGNKTTNPASISVAANTIYFFDFCNTKTIEGDATTYTLESKNNIDYKVNIAQDFGDEKTLTINATEEATAPANIYINARMYEVKDLVINTPYSHVEIDYGESVNVTSKTSLNTFVIKEHYSINGLTVGKGSVVVKGKENGDATVSNITVPAEAQGKINIDVTGVNSSSQKVTIDNKKTGEDVAVVSNNKATEYDLKEGSEPVKELKPEDAVAKIGMTNYFTLEEAVGAVKTNETIELIKDVTLSEPIVTDKTFTLTLNANITPVSTWGEAYNNTKDALVIVNRSGNLTINGTGKISSNHKFVYAAVKMTQTGESENGAAAKLTVDGTVTLEGYYYGIVGNGTRHNTEITVNGGTFKAFKTDEGQGIYHPQDGKLTITGGTFEAYESAIEVRGGTVEITGGTFTSTASPLDVDPSGSGSTTKGAALAIAQHTTKKNINVAVSGGTFNGYKAISVTNPQNNETDNVNVTYKAGTLNGGITLGHGTFNLGADLAVLEPVMVIGKTTLDLGNATLEANFADTKNNIYAPVIVSRGGDLTIEGKDGKINSGEAYGGVQMINPKDTGDAEAKLTVNGGTIEGKYYGIVGNGTRHNTKITINGGIVKGLTKDDNAGIYHPQNGTLTINGGTIEGATGIYVKSGSVSTSISAGTIKGIGKKADYATTGDGFKQTGDAIVFDNCDYPGGAPNASIEGGKFFSTNANAVGSYAKTGKEPITGFISGGLFHTKPAAELIVEGKVAVENTDDATKTDYPWTVQKKQGKTIDVTTPEALADAIEEANAGDEIAIKSAGEYKLPASLPNITISGVQGVEIDCAGSGSIASIPNGATFKNVEITFGQSGYHGFQHAGHIIFDGCTFNGLFYSYGKITFNNCIFNQEAAEYNMWVYAGDTIYSGCIFNSKGKFLNVYNEGNGSWKVTAENCVFNTDTTNKSALNIKETCGEKEMFYDVTITNCQCNEKQKELINVDDGTLYRVSPIWQVDDRKSGKTGIKVKVDNNVVYEAGSPVTE